MADPKKRKSVSKPKLARNPLTTTEQTIQPQSQQKASRNKAAQKSTDITDPIVITGISGNLGRLLTKRLHTDHSIIGIDQRPFRNKPKDVIHHQIDARRRKAEDIFRTNSIQAVVNLGLVHRPGITGRRYREWNTLSTMKLLDYCQRHGVNKVVLMSTAYVYGPQATNSNFLSEDAPLIGNPDYPEMQALIEWDMHAQSFFWKHPEIETVILRPVHVIGPNVRNAPSNYLRLRNPPVLMGFDPMIQVMHEQDLIQAIVLALQPGMRGVFNIVGPGQLPISRIIQELGKDTLPIPHFVAKPMLQKLWRLGLVNFPPGELPHLKYQCMVDGSHAKDVLGFRPAYSLRETIRSVLESGYENSSL